MSRFNAPPATGSGLSRFKAGSPHAAPPAAPPASPQGYRPRPSDGQRQSDRKPQKPARHPVEDLAGQRLVFALRSGICIEGLVDARLGQFARVTEALIISREATREVPWALVDLGNLGHVHPVPVEAKGTRS